jgi:hypothetical protein
MIRDLLSLCILSIHHLKEVNIGFRIALVYYSNITSFFRFVNKRANYPFGIISLAHAPVNVTAFSIGSIHCVRHFPQTYTYGSRRMPKEMDVLKWQLRKFCEKVDILCIYHPIFGYTHSHIIHIHSRIQNYLLHLLKPDKNTFPSW